MFSLLQVWPLDCVFHRLFIRWNPRRIWCSRFLNQPNRVQQRHPQKPPTPTRSVAQRNQGRDFTPEICPQHKLKLDSEIDEGHPLHLAHPSAIKIKESAYPACHFTTSSTTAALNQPAAAAAPIPMKNPSRRAYIVHLDAHTNTAVRPHSYTKHIKGVELPSACRCIRVRPTRPSVECYDYNLNGNNNTRPRPSSIACVVQK